MRIERRFAPVELRAESPDGEPVRLRGYAALFNSMSQDLGGFREQIAPGAFSDSLGGDVRALWNHDSNYPLGRTKSGTLNLWEDEQGLGFEVTPPDTQYARDFTEAIRRGDVDQMSFAFSVEPGGDQWERNNGEPVRKLRRVQLYEVSPVTFPAYEATSVSARALMNLPDIPSEVSQAAPDDAGHIEDGENVQAHRAARQRAIDIERLRS